MDSDLESLTIERLQQLEMKVKLLTEKNAMLELANNEYARKIMDIQRCLEVAEVSLQRVGEELRQRALKHYKIDTVLSGAAEASYHTSESWSSTGSPSESLVDSLDLAISK